MSLPEQNGRISKSAALKFIILLGIVSLFADMTYEGARGINGQYLAILGASGAVVGFVSGFGELLGYGLRLISGYLSDRTKRYWAITFVGYIVNLLAVPLLALAGHWEIAALLMITERVGKAIRTPARDAMLSHATSQTGRGWGFGLHEAMDQIGAVSGPLIVTLVLYLKGAYQTGYAILLIPAILAISVLTVSRLLYPNPRDLEIEIAGPQPKGFTRIFWLYVIAMAFIAFGYADFPLIAFHFEKTGTVSMTLIPILYAVAMGVDALAALVFGRLFDRKGIPILIVAALISAFFAPFAFSNTFTFALFGMVLWGIGMGAQESVMRAAIADMIPADKRGSAYGIFNTVYGISWFLGSSLLGLLYDFSLPVLMVFSVGVQIAAIPFLMLVRRAYAQKRTLD